MAEEVMGTRRAAGTRTWIQAFRHGFRPPTPEQKAADLLAVQQGHELLVACQLIPTFILRTRGKHAIQGGFLHVTKEGIVWKKWQHPDLVFLKGDWVARTTPPELQRGRYSGTSYGLLSLVHQSDSNANQTFRVPTPDLDLIRVVLMGR
jgi:hypothetical protein